MTCCGRSTAPPPSHAEKHVKIMYLCTHTPHNIHHTDHTPSRLVSSLFSSLLFSSHIHLSSAILLKLTFANMSVGLARPCEQDTRMPTNITAHEKLHYPVVGVFVCLLADVVACSLLVGAVGGMFVVCLQ